MKWIITESVIIISGCMLASCISLCFAEVEGNYYDYGDNDIANRCVLTNGSPFSAAN